MTAVQFENPSRCVIQEISIVGNRDDRAGVVLQEAFKPRHAFCIKMVGWLVQQQHVRFREQQAAQCYAAFFAP